MAVKRDKVLRDAEKLVQKGKLEQAIREYEKVLKKFPEDTTIINRVGDLYGRVGQLQRAIELYEEIADHFTRDGFTVHSDEEISFPLASLGGKIDVKTLDGAVSLKIPAGTQPGTVFRLKNKGIPHLKRGGRGDHLVTVQVKVPKRLSRKQKKVLEDWG